MSDKTFEITEANFQKEVLESTEPVLIDFWADWCTPCKMLSPLVDQIAEEYQGKVRVGKLDADANPDVVMRYNVMGLPTLMLFKGGEAVERITGYQPKDKITSKLVPHF
ncbi:MAG: thioredoxin [Chloroflexi bacterium]|nr:thioredoxin [Chloroflexota bacterium]MCC6893835.1 thioredoxin [Anaerolineae bacterium]